MENPFDVMFNIKKKLKGSTELSRKKQSGNFFFNK